MSTHGTATAPLRYLRTTEAAKYLGLAPGTLDKLRVTGGGPTYAKLGRVAVYELADLDAWVAERKRPHTSAA
ncbi:AlpA family transcriptional regulator [Elioraea sp.]|uniref:helix-turn-helix transcriptional regulator n=1 Tax=Elioraea sp. TaxID=2185103 RepID=UPI0025C1CBC8|nr:helix-turn-helix domain-containing protein [Elioraea sp.]